MLKVIRNVESKVIVYASYGNVVHTAEGITDDSISDLIADIWGTDAGYEMITLDTELPEDFEGDKYKLVEDGDSYRFDLIG